MKLLSLFSGIGAFEKALDNLEIPYELAAYCEIDKYASKSYAAIHGVSEEMNLGDITKVDEKALPKDIDLVTYGFPCQDISLSGRQKGLFNEDGSLTRSGLFFEALRIIEETQPRVAIAENVKNLTSKKFAEQFKIVLDSLEQAGYNNYWQVLNAKDYGIPQNRERVFIVSIRKDIDTGSFKFPEGFPLEMFLKDIAEENVGDEYYLTEKQIESIANWKAQQKPFKRVLGKNSVCATLTARGAGEYHSGMILYCDKLNETTDLHEECLHIKEATIKGYAEAYPGDSVNYAYPNSTTRRGRVGHQVAQTLTTSPQQAIVTEFLELRTLTERECFRLIGFSDDDFEKAKSVSSKRYLYKQAGNSIVVSCPYYIIKNLIEANIFQERGKEMELKIYNPTEDGFIKAIEWNHEEIKKEVSEKVAYYKNLVYTDDQIKEAKADRATLRKFVDALETKRKEIKKQCLAPYEDFEKQMKEIVAIVNEPVALIDSQVKGYEEKQKQEKLDSITDFYNSTEHPEWLHLSKIMNEKWLNASTSMKSVQDSIIVGLEKVNADIETLSNLPEFGFEATELYKSTLDVNKAINEAHMMVEMAKAKAAHEAEMKARAEEQARLAAEAEAKKQDETAIIKDTDGSVYVQDDDKQGWTKHEAPSEPTKQWVKFQALLSTEDALALKQFFKDRNIEFEAI